MAPNVPRAIVNLAGYDLLHLDAEHPSRIKIRTYLGGDLHATKANTAFLSSPFWQKRRDDYEPAQGPGYLKTYFENIFAMGTTPMEYTLDDLVKITAPLLLLVGDRDEWCSVEEGVNAFRKLQHGEFGVIPHTGHAITTLVCTVALDFLLRHTKSSIE